MFHVNAWGVTYASAMVGSLVLPGPNLDGKSIVSLINNENITMSFAILPSGKKFWKNWIETVKN